MGGRHPGAVRGSRRQTELQWPVKLPGPLGCPASVHRSHCSASGAEGGCQSLSAGAASLSHSPRPPGQAHNCPIILGHSQPEAALAARNRLDPRSGQGPIEPLALDVVVIASPRPAGNQGPSVVVSPSTPPGAFPICPLLAQICGDDRIRPCQSWIGAPASVPQSRGRPSRAWSLGSAPCMWARPGLRGATYCMFAARPLLDLWPRSRLEVPFALTPPVSLLFSGSLRALMTILHGRDQTMRQ